MHRSSVGGVSRRLVPYALALLLCGLILAWQLRLWRLDLRVPLAYSDDGLVSAMYVKAVVDNGWYLHNPRLGAPAGLDLADFPMADGLHFLLVKLLSFGTDDYALVFNGYFLLTFPLTTLSALLVLRHFGVAAGPAMVAALLFTFLPYHFFRGPHHLWLAAYFLIPPLVMVALWVYQGTLRGATSAGPPSTQYSVLSTQYSEVHHAEASPQPACPHRWAVALLVAALASSAGAYYAFFGSYLLAVAGLTAAVRLRRLTPLCQSAVLVAVIGLGMGLNLAPTLLHQRVHGPAGDAVYRHPGLAEYDGLKLAQLLLPVYAHPVRAWADLRLRYRTLTPLNGENDWAALGLAGSVGFLVLLGRLAYRRRDGAGPGLVDGLAVLNLAAMLLGCVGGLGSVFAFLVSPQIRAYNRIAIYIAFLSFFLLALLLHKAVHWCGPTRRGRWAAAALLGLVLGIGVLDLASGYTKRLYAQQAEPYASNAEFVRAVEAVLPEHGLVFQLPYVSFPEAVRPRQMGEYDHLRPYLHSRTLRWSHGAMRGRVGDVWQAKLAERPAEELLRGLAVAGFAGLYLDRAGYADRGAALEQRLHGMLGVAPLVSRDRRLVCFDLTEYGRRVRQAYSPEELAEERDLLLQPMVFQWSDGFEVLEESGGVPLRWCGRSGTLHIVNHSATTRQVTLTFGLQASVAEMALLRVKGALMNVALGVGGEEVGFTRTLDVPPGRHTIRFTSAGKPARLPNDGRELVFAVRNFRTTEKMSRNAGPRAGR